MSRVHVLLALLACAAMGEAGTLHAQGRGAIGNKKQIEKPSLVLEQGARERKIAEMQVWLGRLAGLFSIEATRSYKELFSSGDSSRELNGVANCSGIGEGPGIRCIIRLIRPPAVVDLPAGSRPNVGMWPPLVEHLPILYFGINPETLEIQSVAVHVQGVAARSGVLAGDRVGFSEDNWTSCQGSWNTCYTVAEMTVEPAGEIFLKLSVDRLVPGGPIPKTTSGHEVDMELHLHREPPAEAAGPRESL